MARSKSREALKQPSSRPGKQALRSETSTRCDGAGLLASLASHHVLIPNPKEVRAYLAPYSDLAALLPTIGEQARREFGPDAELSLELYRDPEIDDRYLTLYVRQPRYDANIMDRIEAVSSRFYDPLEDVSGHVLLATDFRRPRGNDAV